MADAEMTDSEIYNLLFCGGNYSLPYLVKFHCQRNGQEMTLRFINNNESVTFLGEYYATSTFSYTQPDGNGSGGKISITGIDNELIEFIELADDTWTLEVVGVLAKDRHIEPIGTWRHMHGSVSYGQNMKLEFSLGADDRLDMQFCAYTFDTDNNKGNA